jgi:transcriptional regulator with XRE-family HTH domain
MPTEKKTDKVFIQKLSKRIKQLRIDKGYSSYEYFAYDHGISRSQYGRYEKGVDLRVSSLIKLIEAFELTPSDFFKEGFETEKKNKNSK